MPVRHYETRNVLARFLGRFARSFATNSFVFTVSVKEIIDPSNNLQTIPWDVTQILWYICFGLYTHEVGCPSDKCYRARPNLKAKDPI